MILPIILLIFNPENNHIYEYVNSNVDIGHAKEIAEEYLFSSKYSGYILTVDSENERLLFSGTGDSNNFTIKLKIMSE